MGIVRRIVHHGWRRSLPLYDGWSCPKCGAVTIGRRDRNMHRQGHIDQEEWQRMMTSAVRRVCKELGLTVGAGRRDQAEEYEDDDQGDGRGGARALAGGMDGDHYDDENEVDEDGYMIG
jgi:hypothetical protein